MQRTTRDGIAKQAGPFVAIKPFNLLGVAGPLFPLTAISAGDAAARIEDQQSQSWGQAARLVFCREVRLQFW